MNSLQLQFAKPHLAYNGRPTLDNIETLIDFMSKKSYKTMNSVRDLFIIFPRRSFPKRLIAKPKVFNVLCSKPPTAQTAYKDSAHSRLQIYLASLDSQRPENQFSIHSRSLDFDRSDVLTQVPPDRALGYDPRI